jgi:predicted transglutaminase-like cysteine proteinase
MIRKVAKLFNLKLLHVSVLAMLHLQNPAHASHLYKILPAPLLKKIQKEQDQDTSDRFQRWQDLMENSHYLSDRAKLEAVNRFFNEMKWIEDQSLWGKADYWATPVESLLKNAGDCEDFAIAKYFTLLEMGFSEDRLSISYVKFQGESLAHMVLTYYPPEGGEPLILDNIKGDILKSSERDDIQPVFHMNGYGVWRDRAPERLLGPAEEVEEWRKMIARLQAEQSPDKPKRADNLLARQ